MADNPPGNASVRMFTLKDAMILVAAIAVVAMGDRRILIEMSDRSYLWSLGFYFFNSMTLAGPVLAALTVGLVVIRLLSPRPSRVDLFRQPGFVAIGFALFWATWHLAGAYLMDRLLGYEDWMLADEWTKAFEEAAVGIITAWLVLVFTGVWRCERDWIDRSSRFLALIWVVFGLGARLVPAVESWFEAHP